MESWRKFARLWKIRERQISWLLPDASGIVGGAPTKSSLNQLTPVLPVLASLWEFGYFTVLGLMLIACSGLYWRFRCAGGLGAANRSLYLAINFPEGRERRVS